MMLYEAECQKCHKIHEYSSSMRLPVDEIRAAAPMCCGEQTVKIISQSQIGAMNWGREKAVTMPDGTYIETGLEYKKYLKDNNKIPASEGHAEAQRVKERRKKEFKEKLHKTVLDSYDQVKAKKAKAA